ncbi:MAG: site-specific DNA-methyltransferase [Rhodocyclaceae bacterium]|nr:site-specific DNA-methyltransferase [Rhodocyclaceae bacterium]
MADNYDDYTKDQLVRLLRERDRRPRFGLVWERDEIDHDLSINNDFVALDWDVDLSCGENAQDNLIIEGDNFDALRYLRMTHAGRVKCIYIDPPYNTGNRDFIYNDRFIDKDDAYRHSKWLEFMYRRLELSKELLTEDGVIFVSIDDNEGAHLRLLMDHVFGESNHLCTFAWEKRYSPPPDTKDIGYLHESVLAYRASPAFVRQLLPMTSEQSDRYKNPDKDRRGVWKAMDYTCRYTADERPNLYYPISQPNTGEEIWPKRTRVWGMSREVHERNVAEGRIWWGVKGTNSVPALKNFMSEIQQGMMPVSLLKHDMVGHTDEAAKELRELLPELKFTPKPTRLIRHLLNIAGDKNALVLDFFAGSGTTAHAVLNLNKEDGGKRRFILVSSTEATAEAPDKNLCRDVCAERVRRVISGYTNKKGLSVDGLGGGFAYLRCRRIPAATVFRSIQHDQVWTALQLIHDVALTPYQAKLPMQTTESKRGLVIYLPKLTDAVLDTVESAIHSAGQAVVYSWQPALLAQRLTDPRAAFEPIPAFLVNRFGARSSSTTGGRP